MSRAFLILVSCLASVAMVCAQGPVFSQDDLLTLPYEDLSDILRRYPGMYPLDYGTLGSPIYFRPWNLHPWELRVTRDGIPQNRRYDGLYDSNLQPGSELQTVGYDFLGQGAAGTFDLTTRKLPVDSPFTEFQIREGYYGYGTVDFAHGQRVYRSLALEITGRLAWYDGMRENTASRFNRLRGMVGFDHGHSWRSEITYAGSSVDGESPLNASGPYSEREEGIWCIRPKDTVQVRFDPSLRLFLRQDRETWGSAFRAREATGGWVLDSRFTLPRQTLTVRHTGIMSSINFPGIEKRRELSLQVWGSDSVDIGVLGAQVFGGARHETGWQKDYPKESGWFGECGARAESKPFHSLSLFGGAHYTEDPVPVAWRRGVYLLGDRPLVIAPEMSDLNQVYDSGFPGYVRLRDPDRYLKLAVGARWRRGSASAEAEAIHVRRPDPWWNRFISWGPDLWLVRDNRDDLRYAVTGAGDETVQGFAVSAQVPIYWGFRLDSWWSAQADGATLDHLGDSRGYSRLYFERAFFTSPLIIRSHVSYEYLGKRETFSDIGTYTLGSNYLIGFRISATIRGVTLIWGTENFFKEHYEIVPGHNMMAKEEYLAFVWRLWL